jgi:hypothetical protein
VKLNVLLFAFATLLATFCEQTDAIDMANLSLTPFESCKKPPKTPPYTLMHKKYNSATRTNYPFDNNVDINGDGWCDWVSTAARPPHRGDIDEPTLTDFIFLGTQSGWRRFGTQQKVPLGQSQETLPTGNVPVFGFIYPKFVYQRGDRTPFIVVLQSFEDIAPSTMQDIFVLRWDSNLDMPGGANDGDRLTILKFLRTKLCVRGHQYDGEESLASVICDERNYQDRQ